MGHGRDAFGGVVGDAFDIDGAPEAVEGEFDEAILVACDPWAAIEWGIGGGETRASGLVAGGAMAVAGEDIGAEGVEFGGITGEAGGDIDDHFGDDFVDFGEHFAFGGIGWAPEVFDGGGGEFGVWVR